MLVALLGSKGVVELVDTEFNARLRDNPEEGKARVVSRSWIDLVSRDTSVIRSCLT
jgi:hypothetical protein